MTRNTDRLPGWNRLLAGAAICLGAAAILAAAAAISPRPRISEQEFALVDARPGKAAGPAAARSHDRFPPDAAVAGDGRSEPNHPVLPDEPAPEAGRAFTGLRATVRDAASGALVHDFTAWALREGTEDAFLDGGRPGKPPRPGTPFLRARGALAFQSLEAGRYTLLVRAPGYADLVVRGVAVPHAGPDLALPLARGIFISGRVIDTFGEPVAGESVHIACRPADANGAPPARCAAMTDRTGAFLFGGLVPGEYSVRVRSQDEPAARIDGILLGPGGSFTSDLVVPRLNTLSVAVKDARGRPALRALIELRSAEGRVHRARTGPDGKASLPHLPAGSYELEIASPGSRPHRETIVLHGASGEISCERVLD